MFHAEPLLKARVLMLASEAPDAALQLARLGVFNPCDLRQEPIETATFDATAFQAAFPEAPAAAYREAWLEAHARLDKLLQQCGRSGALDVPAKAEAPSLRDLEELNAWLKEVWTACLACQDGETRIEDERKRLDALANTLNTLEVLNVDLAHLLRDDGPLAVHIGSLPAENGKRLDEALAMSGALVYRFNQHDGQVFAVIAGLRQRQPEVQGLLGQAGWRAFVVPEELRTHPQAAHRWLEHERQRLDEIAGAECRVEDYLRGEIRPRLDEARRRLALARPLAEAAQAGVGGIGGLAALTGWIPARQRDALDAALTRHFHGRYWLSTRPPEPGETPPTLVRHPAWLRPYAALVKNYGVPRYGEFDPALPFALIYLLLFGAMFGDVGHGAAIALLSFALQRKLGAFAWIGVAAGAVSMLFGVLYGSVFGFEHVFAPVWQSPLHDPLHLLGVAVAFGIGFIAFTLLVGLRNHWAAGRRFAAVVEPLGLAGLTFYLGLSAALAAELGVINLPGTPAWIAASFGLALLLVGKWHESGHGAPKSSPPSLGERLLVTAIELLETAIGLFSNTLSFMRVAAFSLNHVALALAIFAIADGLSSFGQGIALGVGNVVIIVLEGGIVAIQALRLMYYEGFSRFFSGDGIEFAPLRLSAEAPPPPQPKPA